MLSMLLLFAEEAPKKVDDPGMAAIFSNPIFFLGAVGILFYFVMMRPMRKEEAARKAQIASLKKNDRVIAAGGIIATVVNVKEGEDEVVLRIDDNARMSVLKSSIARVLKKDEEKKDDVKSNS